MVTSFQGFYANHHDTSIPYRDGLRSSRFVIVCNIPPPCYLSEWLTEHKTQLGAQQAQGAQTHSGSKPRERLRIAVGFASALARDMEAASKNARLGQRGLYAVYKDAEDRLRLSSQGCQRSQAEYQTHMQRWLHQWDVLPHNDPDKKHIRQVYPAVTELIDCWEVSDLLSVAARVCA